MDKVILFTTPPFLTLRLIRHLTGELNDTGFGDMADFATMLTDTADAVLIAKYLPWVLQNDLEIGLKVIYFCLLVG